MRLTDRNDNKYTVIHPRWVANTYWRKVAERVAKLDAQKAGK